MHHWSKAASQPLDNVTLQLHVRISQAQHISLPRRRRHLLCLRRKCKIVCNRTKHRHWQFSVENWPKGSGKLAEGKWQINTCSWTGGNKYEIWFGGKSSWKMLNMEVENWPKGEKRLHSRTQLTYARVVTEKVEKVYPLYMEKNFHNLPMKKNSAVFDPSFSRPSTQEGRGTWLETGRQIPGPMDRTPCKNIFRFCVFSMGKWQYNFLNMFQFFSLITYILVHARS